MTSAGERESFERFQRLDAAFRAGDVEALRAKLGSPPDFPNVEAHRAIGSCLGYAIICGPLQLVADLIDAGADLDGPTDDGYPPLIAAITRDEADEMVELLLGRGADANQRDFNDYTALHVAASCGDLAIVELLLANGADPDAVTHIDDPETPLEVAAAAGHADVVERLRPLTTRLEWEDAVRSGDERAVRLLLRSGHDIDRHDAYGQTALMRSAHPGSRDLVELLITEGADLDHAAKYGLSALMLAVVGRHSQVARLLASAGADPTIEGTGAPGFAGRTAADLADDNGDHRLARQLRPPDV